MENNKHGPRVRQLVLLFEEARKSPGFLKEVARVLTKVVTGHSPLMPVLPAPHHPHAAPHPSHLSFIPLPLPSGLFFLPF